MIRSLRFVMVMFVLVIICGCQIQFSKHETAHSSVLPNTFSILITRDFGTKKIGSYNGTVDNTLNLLSAMKQHFQIKTAYDGTFINAINGLESGYTSKSWTDRKKNDWFFYVNGLLSDNGAGDVFIHHGDLIQWDFHSWGNGKDDIDAMIGSFPQPFIAMNQNQTLQIIYDQGFEKAAEELQFWIATVCSAPIVLTNISDVKIESIETPSFRIVSSVKSDALFRATRSRLNESRPIVWTLEANNEKNARSMITLLSSSSVWHGWAAATLNGSTLIPVEGGND